MDPLEWNFHSSSDITWISTYFWVIFSTTSLKAMPVLLKRFFFHNCYNKLKDMLQDISSKEEDFEEITKVDRLHGIWDQLSNFWTGEPVIDWLKSIVMSSVTFRDPTRRWNNVCNNCLKQPHFHIQLPTELWTAFQQNSEQQAERKLRVDDASWLFGLLRLQIRKHAHFLWWQSILASGQQRRQTTQNMRAQK